MRIKEHPVLGKPEKGRQISFFYNGRLLEGYEGEPISAALHAAGVQIHRYTQKKGNPRGVFCAIGRCTDCVMIVDGQPNVRTCITGLEEGMQVETQYGVQSRGEGEIK
jgi:predicted molibdopterin-dependent oxidoreductase YjgC